MSDTLPDPYHPTSSKFPSFIYNKTHSENVDAERIEDGSVMEEKADVIQKLVDIKYKFGPLGSMLSIISFKNWASSQKRVLLYAKPTKRSNIMELVRKSSELHTPVKVSSHCCAIMQLPTRIVFFFIFCFFFARLVWEGRTTLGLLCFLMTVDC